jgi:hypothetical protein
VTTFNIGNQQAVSVNNVGGDMTVHGDVAPAATLVVAAAPDLAALRAALHRLPLQVEQRPQAEEQLDAAEAEMARPEPNKAAAAGRLTRLTEMLKRWGALASGGEGVVGPILRIAALLGPAGAALGALLA